MKRRIYLVSTSECSFHLLHILDVTNNSRKYNFSFFFTVFILQLLPNNTIKKHAPNQITWIFTFAFDYKHFLFFFSVIGLCVCMSLTVYAYVVSMPFAFVVFFFGRYSVAMCNFIASVAFIYSKDREDWKQQQQQQSTKRARTVYLNFGAGCNRVFALHSTG